jgi:hypothetical protein
LVPRSWFFLIVGFWGLVTKSLDADTIFSSQKKFGCWRSLFVFPSFLTWWKIFFSLNLFIIHQIKSEKMHSVLRTMRARKQQQMVKMMRHGEKGW